MSEKRRDVLIAIIGLYVPEINDYNLDMLYKARNSKKPKVK